MKGVDGLPSGPGARVYLQPQCRVWVVVYALAGRLWCANGMTVRGITLGR